MNLFKKTGLCYVTSLIYQKLKDNAKKGWLLIFFPAQQDFLDVHCFEKKINSSKFLLLNRLLGTKVLKNTKHDRFHYILIKDMKVQVGLVNFCHKNQ